MQRRHGPPRPFHRRQRFDGDDPDVLLQGRRPLVHLHAGRDADPHSPHYMDQGEKLYSKRHMKPTWWSEADLMQHVESKNVLEIR